MNQNPAVESVSAHTNPRVRQLEDEICELAAHIDAATFRWLELIREFDDCGGWHGEGMRSCAHWLGWKCGVGLGTAREKLRVAHALKDLPRIGAALADGRLSYSKARAITRVADSDNEEFLLGLALTGTAWHVERAVQLYRRADRAQALARENDRHDLRTLDWSCDADGCLIMKARFTPEQGAVVRRAIEAVAEQLFAERQDVSAETRAFDEPSPLKPHPVPVASRRADALARIAEGWLSGSRTDRASGPGSGGLGSGGVSSGGPDSIGHSSSGDRFVVNIHTDIDTLKSDGCGVAAELEGEGVVSAETSRRLGCDAAVVQWLDDHDGKPLSVGRKTRTVPPAIRRALQRRDRGCRFPGCSCTRFVDAHHIRHWADGGATHANNLVLLCRHHHRMVHEGGFGLVRTAGGELVFTTPAGRRIAEAPETRFSGNLSTLKAANDAGGASISPATPVPNWRGEEMEEDLVLLHLMRGKRSGA